MIILIGTTDRQMTKLLLHEVAHGLQANLPLMC